MLTQKRGSSEVVIEYFSKGFIVSQQRYNATAKECLAVVLAILGYLWGRRFTVVIDHSALLYLCRMQDSSTMLS